jgi:hypothetical protein
VPAWFGDEEHTLRTEIRRDAERFLGLAAAQKIVEREPFESLVAVWHRIPYVESFDDLVDSEWSLDIVPLSLADVLKAGFGKPLLWGLLLELPYYRSSPQSRTALRSAIPWLDLLKNPDSLVTALLSRGWLVFSCQSEKRAERLKSQVRGSFLRCSVLGSSNENG